LKTKAGKIVYPDGPMRPKYSKNDCRFNSEERRHTFSRFGGYVMFASGMGRAQVRKSLREALYEALFPKIRDRRQVKARMERRERKKIR
jgi:hypothetical protein